MHTDPHVRDKTINLLHGAGGELMNALIADVLTRITNKNAGGIGLESLDDGAAIPLTHGGYLVLTTDTHVVKPIFFPGGDIGRIAVSGTVNDLAMMGAAPVALTSAIVLEDGFSMDALRVIIASMDAATKEVDAAIVTGDTKVVEKGALDQVIINTAGIGFVEKPVRDCGLRPGDKLIVTGTVGDHGIAVLAKREDFKFRTELRSDVAPIWRTIKAALDAAKPDGITAMKDPTRGGVASALNEMARKSGVEIVINEEAIPINPAIRAAAEMLGIDVLAVANEGKALIGVQAEHAKRVLAAIKGTPYGRDAAVIGEVTDGERVLLRTAIGGTRFIDAPLGDPVPRVC
ncbi:MAG: hydrogenase expression/formation protein HypE [Euryarchaeota archaeon]|nr:hydrogenase expression/formation protein HypE [Euryarchaeota archaeon]